jgi:hypothetical protein
VVLLTAVASSQGARSEPGVSHEVMMEGKTMSKTIVNKTLGSLKVPLPRGKALHLGPNQAGHISPHDAEHPPLKELIEAGKVEITDDTDNEAIPSQGRHGPTPFER